MTQNRTRVWIGWYTVLMGTVGMVGACSEPALNLDAPTRQVSGESRKGTNSSPVKAKPSEYGVPTEKEATVFAQELESAMEAGNAAVFENRLDKTKMMERVIGDLSESIARPYAREAVREIVLLGTQIVQTNQRTGGSYRFLRVHQHNGQVRALFRNITDGGVNYHDFVLLKNPNNQVVFSDIYIFLSGEFLSHTLRRGVIPAMVEGNKNTLAGIARADADFATHITKIQSINSLKAQGKFAEAFAIYKLLPVSLQKTKLLLMIMLPIAQNVSDRVYQEIIDSLKEEFPEDESLPLLLVDGYAMRKEWKKALEALDQLDKRVDDFYLDVMRANIHLEMGNIKKAQTYAQNVVDMDPIINEPYGVLLFTSLEQKQYSKVPNLLSEIQNRQIMKFDSIENNPLFFGFVKSKHYKKWKKEQTIE